MPDSYDYYDGLAKLVGAAGVVLLDAEGLVLLVKPTYKTVWQLPGGIMEPGETPRAAARREVREEIGLDVTVDRLLSVDHKGANADRPAGIQFVFYGGVLSAEQVARLRLDPDEIEAQQFVSRADAAALVEPGGPAARMTNTLAALSDGQTAYLDNGVLSLLR